MGTAAAELAEIVDKYDSGALPDDNAPHVLAVIVGHLRTLLADRDTIPAQPELDALAARLDRAIAPRPPLYAEISAVAARLRLGWTDDLPPRYACDANPHPEEVPCPRCEPQDVPAHDLRAALIELFHFDDAAVRDQDLVGLVRLALFDRDWLCTRLHLLISGTPDAHDGGDLFGSLSHVRGWLAAIAAAGKCGAYNADRPPAEYAVCVRESGHSGKHDDMWLTWGDRDATSEQNLAAAAEHRRHIAAAVGRSVPSDVLPCPACGDTIRWCSPAPMTDTQPRWWTVNGSGTVSAPHRCSPPRRPSPEPDARSSLTPVDDLCARLQDSITAARSGRCRCGVRRGSEHVRNCQERCQDCGGDPDGPRACLCAVTPTPTTEEPTR